MLAAPPVIITSLALRLNDEALFVASCVQQVPRVSQGLALLVLSLDLGASELWHWLSGGTGANLLAGTSSRYVSLGVGEADSTIVCNGSFRTSVQMPQAKSATRARGNSVHPTCQATSQV